MATVYTDSGTATVTLSTSATELKAHEYTDSATAIVRLSIPSTTEVFTPLPGVLKEAHISTSNKAKVILEFTRDLIADSIPTTNFTALVNGSSVGVSAAVTPPSGGTARQVEVTLARAIRYDEVLKLDYVP